MILPMRKKDVIEQITNFIQKNWKDPSRVIFPSNSDFSFLDIYDIAIDEEKTDAEDNGQWHFNGTVKVWRIDPVSEIDQRNAQYLISGRAVVKAIPANPYSSNSEERNMEIPNVVKINILYFNPLA